MICPNCGEDNSDNFRFCGMCGTPLEARKPVGAPRVVSTPGAMRAAQNDTTGPRTSAANATKAKDTAPSVAGPSFLGLQQSSTNGPDANGPGAGSPHDFPNHDSFFEPEEPKVGARRIVLLLALLAALGAAGWWAFSNYDRPGAAIPAKFQTAAPQSGGSQSAASTPAANPNSSADKAASPDTSAAQPITTAQTRPEQSSNPGPGAVVEEKAQPATNQSAPTDAKPAEKTQPLPPRQSARAAALSDDKGDAAFRKGEAYLYGRGVRENCAEAISNLKAASAKQNAKARSVFGTMYATGHCVPRDLPLSYSWFALALKADPNNQILEKDLVAVWNQMTAPERQMATKMKQ